MADKGSKIEAEDKTFSTDSIVLPLRDRNESFRFHSAEDLESFIEIEREHWEWLTNINDSWNVYSKHLKINIVDVIVNILSQISSNWKNQNEEVLQEKISNLEGILTCVDFPFSCRKTGNAIAVESKKSKLVAANMLYLCSTPKDGPYLNTEMKRISQEFNAISQIPLNGRVLPLNKYFTESEAYRLKANRILNKIELFGADCEASKLVENLSAMSSGTLDIQNKCKESAIELEAWKSAKKTEYDERVKTDRLELRKLGKKILRKIVSLKTEYIRRSSETLKSSEAIVSNAKDVYLSQIEIDASVTYWKNKKRTHNDSKKMWFIALIALLVTTSASPFLIIKYLPVKELTDDKLLLNVLNPITLITSVLVISLLSFLIRLCSKQFSTQQHLFLEAEERKTMLKTYLALMNEGKLVEQEDRKVALDALFRPAQTGIVAEHGNIVPSDTVVKIIERQSRGVSPNT